MAENKIEVDLGKDFNGATTFDVDFYRALFLELRKSMDDLYSERGKDEESYTKYDEAVYNITANAVTNCGAQDFLGYCYKKGFYDFCLMNYDKYMKWTVLAGSNGNAFSLSKLQIFLTTSLDNLYSLNDLEFVYDFLDLTNDNFVLYLSKLLCDEIVKILDITPEALIKLPEKFMEQSEETQKIFDRAKIEAEKIVSEKLNRAISFLKEKYEEQKALNKAELEKSTKEIEQIEKDLDEVPADEKQHEQKENVFRKPHNFKKKFRY